MITSIESSWNLFYRYYGCFYENMDNLIDSSLATTAYGRLKNDIVSGLWEPGTKLGIAALRKYYDSGATPLREALNRLAAEG